MGKVAIIGINSQDIRILAILIGILVLCVLMVLLADAWHWYGGPRKMKRRLRQEPLVRFRGMGNGFRLVNDEYYTGNYNGYPVNIGYSWFSRRKFYLPCYYIEVFFCENPPAIDPDPGKDDPSFALSLRRMKLTWDKGSVFFEHSFFMAGPGVDLLARDLETLTRELRRRQLVPASGPVLPESYTNTNWLSLVYYLSQVFLRRR